MQLDQRPAIQFWSSDSEVKKYAEQALPTLEDHIRMAENIAGKLDMPGKAGLNQEKKAIAVK